MTPVGACQAEDSQISKATPASQKPNIVYILADDLGIGDLGCYGQQVIKTPNIDQLARDGMRFLNHYAGSTVSAPSRCALLTGKDMGHAYIRGNRGSKEGDVPGYDYPLAAGETTVADILKTQHYATGCVGKWGLGGPGSEGAPDRHGFDYFFGYLGQGKAHKYYPPFLWENGQKVNLGGKVYSHDLIVEKALDFIDRSASGPFFLYFTPTIPHAELIVPEGELGEYDGMFEEKPYVNKKGKGYGSQPKPRATYAAMVTRLDKAVGLIVDKLREKGVLENTIILFSSDNGVHAEGGHDPYFFDSNGIYRGIKRDLYDGGIHTPFIVRWDGRVKPNTTTEHISAFWDFLPTIVQIVGTSLPNGINGLSMLPTWTGEGVQAQHPYLYYEFYERNGRRCLIKDQWKLVKLDLSTSNPKTELYYLADDPSEEHDLAATHPDKVAELEAIMATAHVPSPLWQFKQRK